MLDQIGQRTKKKKDGTDMLVCYKPVKQHEQTGCRRSADLFGSVCCLYSGKDWRFRFFEADIEWQT